MCVGATPHGRKPESEEKEKRAPLALPEGRGDRLPRWYPPKPKTAEQIDEEVRKRRARAYAKDAVRSSRERGLRQLQEDPEDPRHGTPTGYIYGCRCERCRDNWNDMRRTQDRKAKKRRRGRPRNRTTRKRGK